MTDIYTPPAPPMPRTRRPWKTVGQVALVLVLASALAGVVLWRSDVLFSKAEPKGAASPVFGSWQNPNSIPLRFDPAGTSQFVVEVIEAPVHGGTLTAIEPFVSWSNGLPGERLFVNVLRLRRSDHPMVGEPMARGSAGLFALMERGYHSISLQRSVELEPGAYYSLIFTVRSPLAAVSMGLAQEGDPYPKGTFWRFGRVFGANGEILSEQERWAPDRGDLVFRLHIDPSPDSV